MKDMQKHILLVDDDRDICQSIQEALEIEGYGVLSAYDGKQALELLAQDERRPCLILVDLMMPEMDGVSLLRRLSEDHGLRHVPAVIFTASNPTSEVMQEALEYADKVIPKPVDLYDLLDVIANHCKPAVA